MQVGLHMQVLLNVHSCAQDILLLSITDTAHIINYQLARTVIDQTSYKYIPICKIK